MPIDTTLLGALHVQSLRGRDLPPGGEHPHHALFQTSTIAALLEGKYDGDVSFGQLRERGDFGLGTFDALDGEMIALDGAFYQVRADGRAYPVPDSAKTPFAVVTFFEPTLHHKLTGPMDFEAFCSHLDESVGDGTVCHAVRLDGHFEHIRTRSVPRQRKPYPSLVEAVSHQPTFDLQDVEGTLVGFHFPSHAEGINVAGYHFHFITSDREAGGHVLGFGLTDGELSIDAEADLQVELPPGVVLPEPGASPEDRETLDRIERG